MPRESQNSLSSLETDTELNIIEVTSATASCNIQRMSSKSDSQRNSLSWWPSFRRTTSFNRSSVEISALTSMPPQPQTNTQPFNAATSHSASVGALQKRYQVWDYVLIHVSTILAGNHIHHHDGTYCVNRLGYPPGHGETVSQRNGPYVYVWAKVQTLHHEENHPYYTVRRLDTRTEFRADASQMEIIYPTPALLRILYQQEQQQQQQQHLPQQHRTSNRSLLFFGNKKYHPSSRTITTTNIPTNVQQQQAAHPSATQHLVASDPTLFPPLPTSNSCWQHICHYLLDIPFWWICVCIPQLCCRPCLQSVVRSSLLCFRKQARQFLYGDSPYVCQVRLTMVNFVVLCSTWFLFSDQIRLAFFSESADYSLAIINLVVWCVLVLELLFQVFIRPDGYSDLLHSDKAFAPTTIRYINGFHLFVETISLGIFVSEFLCIFSGESCSARNRFSFYNAALVTLIGPTRKDAFFGYAFIALIRLRVFGVVRHWRNMWINKRFIDMKWKSNQRGIWSDIVPRGAFRSGLNNKIAADTSELEVNKKNSVVDLQAKEHKTKDAALTNASNIGTALMSSNSHRALAIAWCIMGLFPVVTFTLSSAVINDMTDNLTAQLQGTNLLASDDGNQTCQFYIDSLITWIMSLSGDRLILGKNHPLLLSLNVQPYRCGFDGENSTNVQLCQYLEQSVPELPTNAYETCQEWYRAAGNFTNDDDLANAFNVRVGSVIKFVRSETSNFTNFLWGINFTSQQEFIVETSFDQTLSLRVT